MALVFMDGFDHYNTDGFVAQKWDIDLAGVGPSSIGSGRFGTGRSITIASSIAKLVPAAQTYVLSFAAKFTNVNAGATKHFVKFIDGSTLHVTLLLNSSGQIEITRDGTTTLATAATPLVANTWYHFQVKVKIDNSTGSVEVRIDGSAVNTRGVSVTGVDTRNGGNATLDQILIQGFAGTFAMTVDDVVINDTSGSRNNDFPGESRIQTVFPAADGLQIDWTPSTSSNHSNVDENPPDGDTTYNYSNTPDDIDLYELDPVSVTGDILGVQVNFIHRKDDAGTREIAEISRKGTGGADFVGATKACGSDYFLDRELLESDPDTDGPWDESAVNDTNFGVKVIT